MRTIDTVQVAVEVVSPAVRVVRVAGRLTVGGALRIANVVAAQCRLVDAGATTDLVVDLAGVGSFEPGAVEMLVRARENCASAQIGMHIAGCAAHLLMLPIHVRHLLTRFSSFPTVDAAIGSLVPGG